MKHWLDTSIYWKEYFFCWFLTSAELSAYTELYDMCQKSLTLNKEKKNWTAIVRGLLFSGKYVLQFIWKQRSQSLEEEERAAEFKLLHVQRDVFILSDDLRNHVTCWCLSSEFFLTSPKSAQPVNFRALHAPAEKPHEDSVFIFQHDLAPVEVKVLLAHYCWF